MKPLHVSVAEDELDKGIMSASGVIEGLPADLSRNIDAYLAEAHVAVALPRRRGVRAKRLRRP